VILMMSVGMGLRMGKRMIEKMLQSLWCVTYLIMSLWLHVVMECSHHAIKETHVVMMITRPSILLVN
jgi:hypothetical protein